MSHFPKETVISSYGQLSRRTQAHHRLSQETKLIKQEQTPAIVINSQESHRVTSTLSLHPDSIETVEKKPTGSDLPQVSSV